jgi:hypothetical protein
MTAASHLKVRGRHRPRPRHLTRARAPSTVERVVVWLLILALLSLGMVVAFGIDTWISALE